MKNNPSIYKILGITSRALFLESCSHQDNRARARVHQSIVYNESLSGMAIAQIRLAERLDAFDRTEAVY